jgi:aminoglycoside N3'-acetyltransferase
LIKKLLNTISEINSLDDKSIVIHGMFAPFFFRNNLTPKTLMEMILSKINLKKKNLLMPFFILKKIPNSYSINFDKTKCQTGSLNQNLIKKSNTKSSLSCHFTWCIQGKDGQEFSNLKPFDVWGKDSPLEWMYKKKVRFITVNVNPALITFVHYVEWLYRDKIKYRKLVTKSGSIISKNERYKLEERYWFKKSQTKIIPQYENLLDPFLKNGLKTKKFNDILIGTITSDQIFHTYEKILKKDPLLTIKNKKEVQKKYY